MSATTRIERPGIAHSAARQARRAAAQRFGLAKLPERRKPRVARAALAADDDLAALLLAGVDDVWAEEAGDA